jgi:dienelactone hydrolase
MTKLFSVFAAVAPLVLTVTFLASPADGQGPDFLPPQWRKVFQADGVATAEYNWLDPLRRREVLVKVYYPEKIPGPLPVIVFSPGLGRSRDDYAYLGQYWAAHGYVSVHVQHHGSDDAVRKWKLQPMKALREALEDPLSTIDRCRDISFVIDQLVRMHVQNMPLGMRLDVGRIGVAGNDLGAQTALVVAGQALHGRITRADPRVKALVAMSPPAPPAKVPLDEAYKQIHVPCLYMTGTEDDGLAGTTRAEHRRQAFDNTSGAAEYLLTFRGADNLIYSGHKLDPIKGLRDPLYQRLICVSSTVFWNAYLKDDPNATAWLLGGGLENMLQNDGRLEKKLPSTAIDDEW